MNILRAALGILGVALIGLIIWSATSMQDLHGGLPEQFAVITTLPWGLTTVADLYLGFVLFGVLVFLTERSWIIAALWAAPVLVLGNVWAVVWFIIRVPHLAKQLSKPDWPAS